MHGTNMRITYQTLHLRRVQGLKFASHYPYVIRNEIRNLRLFISTTTVLIDGVLLKNANERLNLLHIKVEENYKISKEQT
jgi:hypothetical protein